MPNQQPALDATGQLAGCGPGPGPQAPSTWLIRPSCGHPLGAPRSTHARDTAAKGALLIQSLREKGKIKGPNSSGVLLGSFVLSNTRKNTRRNARRNARSQKNTSPPCYRGVGRSFPSWLCSQEICGRPLFGVLWTLKLASGFPWCVRWVSVSVCGGHSSAAPSLNT